MIYSRDTPFWLGTLDLYCSILFPFAVYSALDPGYKFFFFFFSFASQLLGDCWGTTAVLTIFLQPSLSSASLRVLARGSSVHSLMSSSQRFFGLPHPLPLGTVACMVVLASPVDRVTCLYHLRFLVLTMERLSCGPVAALTWFLTSSFLISSLNEMPKILL